MAIKEFKDQVLGTTEKMLPHFLIREMDALIKLQDHPNIVQLLEIFRPQDEGSNGLILVFEFLEQGELGSHIKTFKKQGMPISLVLDYTEQILEGLHYIHSNGFLHRDLKPGNILLGDIESAKLDSKRVVKIADFGLARQRPFPSRTMSKEIQTLQYRAPEIMLGNLNYASPVDCWSVGVIVFEMLTGQKMFHVCSEIEFVIELIKLKGTPTRWTLSSHGKFSNLVKMEQLMPKISEPVGLSQFKDKLPYGF